MFRAFLKYTMLIVFGLVALIMMLAAYLFISPRLNTRYAPQFEKKGWAKIEPGMTFDKVSQLIGPPLSQRTNKFIEIWHYGDPRVSYTQKNSLLHTETTISLFDDDYDNVWFDSNGIYTGQSQFAGMSAPLTKDDARRAAGEPDSIDISTTSTTCAYSTNKNPDNDVYYSYCVNFDHEWRVKNTVIYSMD